MPSALELGMVQSRGDRIHSEWDARMRGLPKFGTTNVQGPHNVSSVVGTVLNTIGCLAASLASPHWRPVASSSVMRTKNISRYHHMSPRGENCSVENLWSSIKTSLGKLELSGPLRDVKFRTSVSLGHARGLRGKESTCNARDTGSVPG